MVSVDIYHLKRHSINKRLSHKKAVYLCLAVNSEHIKCKVLQVRYLFTAAEHGSFGDSKTGAFFKRFQVKDFCQ